jgi:hypothetical protein
MAHANADRHFELAAAQEDKKEALVARRSPLRPPAPPPRSSCLTARGVLLVRTVARVVIVRAGRARQML